MDYRNMTDLKFVYMKPKKTIRLDSLSMKNYFVKNTHLQVDKKTSPILFTMHVQVDKDFTWLNVFTILHLKDVR